MGDLDSTGIYDHGKKNGSFLKLKTYSKDSIITIWENDYIQDSLVKSVDLLAERQKKKSSDTSQAKESSYPGGIEQWSKFMVKNFRFPERAGTKDIQGKVRILFKVDKNGNISDSFIQKSLEYSLDEEALRLINQSGKWEPALLNSVPVDSYKVQSFTFTAQTQ